MLLLNSMRSMLKRSPELWEAAEGGTLATEFSSAGAQEKKRPKFSDA
jgi:hypothetical protein